MRTLLLSAFCVLALNVQSMEVKKDTIHKYVIDNQVVKNFDGTQLEGKMISKYIIAYKNMGDAVEKNHVIVTGNPTITINPKFQMKGMIGTIGNETIELFVVDGKEMDLHEFEKVKADDIFMFEIHKPGSKVANSYGKKGEKGVMTVVTKSGKSDDGIIYFVNGKRVEKKDINNLTPNRISSMKINKKDGHSVIEITTKK